MALDQIAEAYYVRRATHTRAVVAAILALWRAAGPSGFRGEVTQAAGILAAGQLVAATLASAYLDAVTADQGLGPGLRINPRRIAGTTGDDLPLTDVLTAPTRRTWALMDSGADYASASLSGEATLTRIVANEVTQAATDAVTVGMVGNQDVTGFVRVLHTPSCGRCAVIAGRWYAVNDGFDRHPGCDCVHVPAAERATVAPLQTSADAYFRSLSDREANRRFGAEVADKIRAGADVTKTVNNAQRGTHRYRTAAERWAAAKSRDTAVADLIRTGYLAAA